MTGCRRRFSLLPDPQYKPIHADDRTPDHFPPNGGEPEGSVHLLGFIPPLPHRLRMVLPTDTGDPPIGLPRGILDAPTVPTGDPSKHCPKSIKSRTAKNASFNGALRDLSRNAGHRAAEPIQTTAPQTATVFPYRNMALLEDATTSRPNISRVQRKTG